MMLRPLSTRLIATQKVQLLSLAQRSLLPSSTVAPAHYFTNLASASSSSASSSVSSPVSLLSNLPTPLQISIPILPVPPPSASPVSPQTVSPSSTSTNPTPQFNFVVAASWNAKHKALKHEKLGGDSKVPYWKRTQVGKVDAGEDAFFHTSTPSGLALGVADGVGGWSEVGVDPALFSWTLMNNAAAIAKDPSPFLKAIRPPTPPPSPPSATVIEVKEATAAKRPPSLHAKEILSHAFEALVSSGRVKAGSSTACILDLCTLDGTMTSSNLGDSSFLLIRDREVVYESPSQQHFFNCPYQLSVIPENYPNQTKYIRDSPLDADSQTFQLKDGDLILLATDGFFDNVFSHEALAIVNKEFEDLFPADEDVESTMRHIRKLARELTNTARNYSLDSKRVSPWAHHGRKQGLTVNGGKVDDITCIVTLVQSVQDS